MDDQNITPTTEPTAPAAEPAAPAAEPTSPEPSPPSTLPPSLANEPTDGPAAGESTNLWDIHREFDGKKSWEEMFKISRERMQAGIKAAKEAEPTAPKPAEKGAKDAKATPAPTPAAPTQPADYRDQLLQYQQQLLQQQRQAPQEPTASMSPQDAFASLIQEAYRPVDPRFLQPFAPPDTDPAVISRMSEAMGYLLAEQSVRQELAFDDRLEAMRQELYEAMPQQYAQLAAVQQRQQGLQQDLFTKFPELVGNGGLQTLFAYVGQQYMQELGQVQYSPAMADEIMRRTKAMAAQLVPAAPQAQPPAATIPVPSPVAPVRPQPNWTGGGGPQNRPSAAGMGVEDPNSGLGIRNAF